MEEWKDIDGYNGLYIISSTGNVYSHISKKQLKPLLSSTGYYNVQLYKNSKAKAFLIHILVATAFIGPKPKGYEVNHIDGNKLNNSVDNLEWVTRKRNTRHAIENNLRKACNTLGKTGARNRLSKPILQYDINGNFIKEWIGIAETARTLNYKECSISACLNGRHKTAHGFIWKPKLSSNYPLKISPVKVNCQESRTPKHKGPRKMHRIVQLSIDHKLIKIWDNYKQLIAETNYNNGNIYKAITGKAKTAYGFIWEYYD